MATKIDCLERALIDFSTESVDIKLAKCSTWGHPHDYSVGGPNINDVWNFIFKRRLLEGISKLDFDISHQEGNPQLQVHVEKRRLHAEFFCMSRTFRYALDAKITSLPVPGKLRILESELSTLKPIVEKAAHDFKRACLEKSINPHPSLVHSFHDTLAQAYVLAIPGRTKEEQYDLAYMAFCSHAFDDYIETARKIDKGLPYKAQQIKEMMMGLGGKSTQLLINSMVHGALIQQSKTWLGQRRRILNYRRDVLANIRDEELQKDLEALHPALLAQGIHVGMAGLYGLEQGIQNEIDLGARDDVYYAGALYFHDNEEEREHEASRILYGTRFCENDRIRPEVFIPMIDIFDKHAKRIPDERAKEHYMQRKLEHEAFKDTIPIVLRERYEQSLANNPGS